MEIWKPIPGYEGLYEASSFGRIRTAEGKTTYSDLHGKRVWKQRILKPKACSNYNACGYRVSLWKDKKPKDFLVARLVCTTFHENLINTKMTVNHKDGNRLNNHIDNLEWLTLADNIRDGFKTGLYRSSQKPVSLLAQNGKEIYFDSISECSKFLGRNTGYVSMCVSRGRGVVSSSGNKYKILLQKRA